MNEPNFQSEIDYWDKELSLNGVYPNAIINRSTTALMIKEYPHLLEKYRLLLEKQHDVNVLDVGSGPLSMLAYGHYSRLFMLDCVDPLASIYLQLLAKYHLEINYKMISCPGESLDQVLQNNHYDLVWIHNALDHSQDPSQVMRAMTSVLAPKGYLCIAGWAREGTAEGFAGLHQHDLYLLDGHLTWCTKQSPIPVRIDALPELRTVEQETENITREWFHIVYQKL